MNDDEIGVIKAELNACKEQLYELRSDIQIVVRYSPGLRDALLALANQSGPGWETLEIKRCQEFKDKYQIRPGSWLLD
jgi:hypothetical protein